MRASGTSRLHFIEVEVHLWQIFLEAFMQDVSNNFEDGLLLWIATMELQTLMPSLHYAGEIWKGCLRSVYHSENTSIFFRPHLVGEIWKRNIGFVFEEIWTSSFWKSPIRKRFPSMLKHRAGVFKFLGFDECFLLRSARFYGKLLWTTEFPTVEIRLSFQISLT